MNRKEIISFLAFCNIGGLGYRNLYKIANSNYSFSDVFYESNKEKLLEILKNVGLPETINFISELSDQHDKLCKNATETNALLKKNNINILFPNDDCFPSRLKMIPSPPKWLFVQGNLKVLNSPSITIVGTRNPTWLGRHFAEEIILVLRDTDIVTISGLAKGIDSYVHDLSIYNKIPTIAVLGGGILHKYSKSDENRRTNIIHEGGCIISEYLPLDKPSRDKFINRNRLQSGISKITCPVEWKIKSGTAHTVKFALNQGKVVFGLKLKNSKTETSSYIKENGGIVFTLPNEIQDVLETIFRNYD